jgi:hypothetical protein
MAKVRIDIVSILGAFPEAIAITYLPRKKKKALKKKIEKRIIQILEESIKQEEFNETL